MSKKFFFLPALLLGAFLMFAPSCGESDPCKDVECGANGDCFEGECVCNVGYEIGSDGTCSVKTIDKITGLYNVTEDCTQSAPASYIATIASTGTDGKQISITNFWDLFNAAVTATIDSPTKITIARQEPDKDKFFVEGTGTVSTNASGKTVITWTYKVTDESVTPAKVDNCTNTVYTK